MAGWHRGAGRLRRPYWLHVEPGIRGLLVSLLVAAAAEVTRLKLYVVVQRWCDACLLASGWCPGGM
jgi:hypothetical protein